MLNIIQLNRDERRSWEDTPPAACPLCGTPLTSGPDSELRCLFEGWTWDGTMEGKRGTA